MHLSARNLLIAIALAGAHAAMSAPATSVSLQEQRQAFRAAYSAAERGNWEPAATADLRAYPLWPDLRAAFLRARLAAGSDDGILEFVDAYPTLRVSRDLRYRLALSLGAAGRHDEFLAQYERHYSQMGVVRLDCVALAAKAAKNETGPMPPRALEIWLAGHSQPDECDPVFAALRQRGLLGPDEYRQRYELALEAGEFRLARYLARSVDDDLLLEGNRWLAAQGNPTQFIDTADPAITGDRYRDQLAYAIRRLAMTEPDDAATRWTALTDAFGFGDELRLETLRDIALWSARNGVPEGRRRIDGLPPGAVDSEVLRWRARAALRDGDWPAVISAIDRLEENDRNYDGWRYWKAIALQQLGHADLARPVLMQLAEQRGYYGFLAADGLDIDYRYGHTPLQSNEAMIAELAARPALVRARELYFVGLEGLGRSEWDAEVDRLGDAEKQQAAILADRWGWHSRAITTAAQVNGLDDLVLRYPLPYREEFQTGSAAAGIPESWAYGIARSESLFMRDIRSNAGAVGLMQLLPETGHRTAADLQHPYAGWDTLVDPPSNILLGTRYLGNMYQRFASNPVLATAAYNAGPLRVEQWLPQRNALDARVWVEVIPFDETRSYVRRVLESSTIFHWRMTGETRRLSSRFDEIAVPPPAQVAAQ